MLARPVPLAALAVAAFALAGCGPARLNESRSYDVDPSAVEGFMPMNSR